MVWEMALIEYPTIIDVGGGVVDPPGLLEVNKEIRSETIGIYYSYNLFRVHINDYNVTPVLSLLECIPKYFDYTLPCPDDRPTLEYRMYGRRDWRNLYAWIRQMHERGERTFPHDYHVPSTEIRALNGLLKVVNNLVASGVEWETIGTLLAGFREMMSAQHPEWLRDYND